MAGKLITKPKSIGFTLIELLVALVVLGTVLIPFLGFVSYRLHKERENDDLIKALELGRAKIEQTLLLSDPEYSETPVLDRFLVKTEIFTPELEYNDKYELREIRVSVIRIKDQVVLVRLCALK